MKIDKIIIPMLLISTSSVAAPYIGAEFGAGTIGSSVSTIYTSDSGKHDQYDKNEIFGVFTGYKFDSERVDSFGLELGYRNYSSKDFALNGNGETKMDASQFSLKPVYFYNINEKITLKSSVGLTHTHYKFKASYLNASETRNENVYGAIVGIGADAVVTEEFTIGAQLAYQIDEVAHTTTITINSAYHF